MARLFATLLVCQVKLLTVSAPLGLLLVPLEDLHRFPVVDEEEGLDLEEGLDGQRHLPHALLLLQ